MVGLGMQVLEWRITASDNKSRFTPDNKHSFSGYGLFSMYMYDNHLDTERTGQFPSSYPKVRLTWTGSKVELVELIYAWETAGCFNHGHATIKEIAAYIEVIFNVDLGDYYDTFRDMRNRVNRTAFLDKLIKVLNDRMDEADRKK
jgi:hypothetical protein